MMNDECRMGGNYRLLQWMLLFRTDFTQKYLCETPLGFTI